MTDFLRSIWPQPTLLVAMAFALGVAFYVYLRAGLIPVVQVGPQEGRGDVESRRRTRAGLLGAMIVGVPLFALVALDRAQASAVVVKLSAFALDPKVLLGLFFLFLASRTWRATLFDRAVPRPPGTAPQNPFSQTNESSRDEVRRFGFTRHWGGLGAGEGGWELDAVTARWALNAFVLIALSAASATLLLGLRDGGPVVDASAPDAGGGAAPASQVSAASDAGAAKSEEGSKPPDRESPPSASPAASAAAAPTKTREP